MFQDVDHQTKQMHVRSGSHTCSTLVYYIQEFHVMREGGGLQKMVRKAFARIFTTKFQFSGMDNFAPGHFSVSYNFASQMLNYDVYTLSKFMMITHTNC